MAANSIHRSEREDFETEVRRRRRSPDEFELLTDDPVMTGTHIQPTRGTVTARNKSTGAARTYSYMTWVTDFMRDLDAGVL